jgi:glutathione S-transferase
MMLVELKGNNVPFFVRPVTTLIANQLIAMVVFPNMKRHFAMMEQFLETTFGDGNYMCGRKLTGADIMLSYPLISGKDGAFNSIGAWEKGSFKETFPKLHAYSERLADQPGWKKSVDKIKEMEGSFSLLPAPGQPSARI